MEPPGSQKRTRAFVSGSFSYSGRRSRKVEPTMGSPPMLTQVLCPMPAWVSIPDGRSRNRDDTGGAASSAHGSGDAVKNRNSMYFRAAFAWGDASEDLSAVTDGLRRKPSSFASCDALNQHARLGIN